MGTSTDAMWRALLCIHAVLVSACGAGLREAASSDLKAMRWESSGAGIWVGAEPKVSNAWPAARVCRWCRARDRADGSASLCVTVTCAWGFSLQSVTPHKAGLISSSSHSSRPQGFHTQVSTWGAPGQLGLYGGCRGQAGRRETLPSAIQPVLHLG